MTGMYLIRTRSGRASECRPTTRHATPERLRPPDRCARLSPHTGMADTSSPSTPTRCRHVEDAVRASACRENTCRRGRVQSQIYELHRAASKIAPRVSAPVLGPASAFSHCASLGKRDPFPCNLAQPLAVCQGVVPGHILTGWLTSLGRPAFLPTPGAWYPVCCTNRWYCALVIGTRAI